MFLTMNRFKVKLGHEEEFEQVWASRETRLQEVPGFRGFHLMRGAEQDEYRLYASHTAWDSESAFAAWTTSEAFRAAHGSAGSSRDMYVGPPELEVFESVQSVEPAE